MVGSVTRFTPPLTTRLADPDSEAVRRNHEQRITEFQRLPIAGGELIRNVAIPNASDRLVPHGLGRAPLMVIVSPPRGANAVGMVRELRGTNPFSGAPIDSAKAVCLRADSFASTITVDVLVF